MGLLIRNRFFVYSLKCLYFLDKNLASKEKYIYYYSLLRKETVGESFINEKLKIDNAQFRNYMHTISKEYFLQAVEPLLKKVFVGNNDTEPFNNCVKNRLLLYYPFVSNSETDYLDEKKLVESLAFANQQIGEDGYYLVSSWQQYPTIPTPNCKNNFAYIAQEELVDAIAAPPGSSKRIWSQLSMYHINYCLFSTNGTWGLFKTYEDHGFLGGNLEFIQAVKSYFPGIENKVSQYLYELRQEQIIGEPISISWLQQLLNHIYGEKTTQKLLQEAELV